jgi:hypothetical protein
MDVDVKDNVKWVPYHYSMAHPQVKDGKDGLQIGKAAE